MAQWQSAFISGGNSGIGLHLAQLLLRQGTNLALFDLQFSDQVKAELSARAGTANVSFHTVDVRDADALATAVNAAADELPAPDLAINCAGVQLAIPFEDYTSDSFNRVVDINLNGSRNFATALLPHLQAGSQLALVASLAGLVANHSYAAYNASKYGVVGLAGALRLECINRGVTVSVICPPEVDTPMVVEERRMTGAITQELKAVAGTLTVEQVGRDIMQGLGRRRYMIIPGFRARMIWRFGRWFPGILNAVSARVVRKHA
jgi:NAD(P)-dependent dehydrogenase (short-subunit alcohol dehydrogenase family)